MIPRTSARTILIVVVSLVATAARAAELGTAFTYQGELELDGRLVTGQCDFEFRLWDADGDPDIGSQIGPTLTFDGLGGNPPPIALEGGRFTVPLDFGSAAVTGDARWLEISVCCASPCAPAYSLLAGRQELTPAPHAIRASTGVGPPNALEVDAATGNVGIGTASPASRLTVAGEIESTAGGVKFPDGSVQTSSATAYPWSVDGDDIFYTAGGVGIGTAGPLLGNPESLNRITTMPTGTTWAQACVADPTAPKIWLSSEKVAELECVK